MRVKSYLTWAIALAALVGWGSLGAVGFTDQGLDAGYLNPGDDGIAVQQIRVRGDGTKAAQFDAITVRNLGSATHEEIIRIELWDSGVQIGAVDDPIGLSTGGVTIPVDYVLAAGAVADIEVRVDVAGVADIAGGETLILEVRFHYFLNGTAYTSAWLADGTAEEIVRAGFEEIQEITLAAGNYNPGDGAGNPVQRVTFTDNDANTSAIQVNTVTVRNLGTAAATDIDQLIVTVVYNGTDYVANPAVVGWKDGGVTIDHAQFLDGGNPWDGQVADDAAIEIVVEIVVAGSPTDGRTVRSKVEIDLDEQQPGGEQGFIQSSQAPTTQTIREAGVEEIDEQSTAPASGVLNPGESLVQTIEVRDNDVNGDQPSVTRIWVQNQGTAGDDELESITVRVNGTIINTFNAFAGFATTGVWLNIADQPLDDDGKSTIQILYRVGDVTSGHTLQPRVRVESSEAGKGPYETQKVDYPAAIELRDPGFEYVEDIAQDSTTVFTGQRFCAQKIRLDDQDENDDDITINPVVIKNLGSATGTDVVKIEVRTADGERLGETEDTSGFKSGGVTIPTLDNNAVADDGQMELWIWVTIASPEEAAVGHTVRLQTTVFHQENGATYSPEITSAATFTIAINHRPEVDFSWSPADPTWEDTITFTPAVTDPDGDALVEYEWDFGDGSDPVVKTTAEAVTHQYPDGGTYTVTLTVTDERGLTGTNSKQITVQPRPNQPPEADFDWAPAEPEAGDVVTFTATASDPDDPPDTPLTYAWDFGDGTSLPPTENSEATHIFAAAGTYTVTLTVTDSRGAETEVQKEITVAEAVNDPPQVTALEVTPASPEAKQEITFTATATDPEDDDITDWEWDFDGDGTVDATTVVNTATYTYTAPGFYTVRVRAKDGGGSNSFGPWYEEEFYVRGTGAAAIGTRLTQNPVATEAVIEFFAPAGATEIRLRVFDLLGRPVFESTTPTGNRFRWDLTDLGGDTVPNGLYFYLITATLDGRTIRSEVGRILVLR
ncbi:TPA: PKD domain-containing protein [Candidatus Bipolaricaulota bacterium]|nr:PKD domain-containing protein [Candidatus Bipolaricaulota bacterium]